MIWGRATDVQFPPTCVRLEARGHRDAAWFAIHRDQVPVAAFLSFDPSGVGGAWLT